MTAYHVIVIVLATFAAECRPEILCRKPETTATSGGINFVDNGQCLDAVATWMIRLQDVDGDKAPDAYFEKALWLNDGRGHFNKTETSFGTMDAWFADFNGDGAVDAVCQNWIYINDGKGNFSKANQLPSDIDMGHAVPVDIDNDGDIDLITANANSDRLFINNGSGVFRKSPTTFGGWGQCRYAVGDIDNDGVNDLYVAIPHTPAPEMLDTRDKIWIGTGNGDFSERGNEFPDGESRDAILGDFNGDGSPDLFIADAVSPGRLLLNDGRGGFTDSGQRLNEGLHATTAKAADFDGDGDLDIFIANGKPFDPGSPNTVWLNDGKGGFSDSLIRLGNSNSLSADLADLDGDARVDIVAVNINLKSGSAPVEIWLNKPLGCSYLNETPPGDQPALFGKGTISIEGVNSHTCSFSPQGDQLFFSRFPDGRSYMMNCLGQQWSPVSEAPFDGMEITFSPDGRRVFYHVKYDLYYRDKLHSGWGDPVKMGNGINTGAQEFFPCSTFAGTLYFSRNGKWSEARLLRSKLVDGGYAEPEDLGSPINDGGALHAFVSRDESYILFNSPREGSFTDLDIWVSFRKEDGSWGAPMNLGKEINGGAQANLCPTVTPDGRYLFYTKRDENGNGLIYWVGTGILDTLRNRQEIQSDL